MAFQITTDDYTVLSIAGAYYLVDSDSYNTQSFVFQIANNITIYPSVSILYNT
jgi:hypothetical protein